MKTKNVLCASLLLLGMYSCEDKTAECSKEDWVGTYELTSSKTEDCIPMVTGETITISYTDGGIRIGENTYDLDDCRAKRSVTVFGTGIKSEIRLNGNTLNIKDTQQLLGMETSCEAVYTKKQ